MAHHHNELCDHKPFHDNKHTIIVIECNEAHGKQLADSLISFYYFETFDNAIPGMAAIQRLKPAVILVAEDIAPKGAFHFVRELRKNKDIPHIPVIILLSDDETDRSEEVKECGAEASVTKPFLRSTLINEISHLLNSRVEQVWEKLAPVQTKALKNTVAVFNTIADTIASGEPIIYTEATEACSSLVEAVNSDNYMGILHGVKHHDNYTYVHSMRVATMLSLFGNTIGLDQEDQKMLAAGGLLHDVGKMTIPHAVLNKPGKLTEEEFELMKSHVTGTVHHLEKGEGIPKGVIVIAEQHHEKLDGTGYPYGIAGKNLNDLARMGAIVDIFSALTDRRVYKPAMDAEKALELMKDEMSGHIDLKLLSLFRQRFLDIMTSTAPTQDSKAAFE